MVSDFTKHDDGKPRWDLLPWGPIEEVVKIMTDGAVKYEDNNWRGGTPDRYFAALMRHLVAWREGETIDPDSGSHHMAHVATNAIFILELLRNK